MAGNVKVTLKSVWDDKGVRDAQQQLGNLGKGLGVAFAAVSAAVVGAGVAVAGFASKAVDAAENVRQADNRLGQVAKSMGLFGSQTADVTNRLIALAEANEVNLAIDAETIKLTQSKLLTFKELAGSADEAGGAFDRATMAALDLAAAGFGSAETNATQLGKALQDPIKGLTALTRSGVTFTKQEKENIKTLVESGQTLKAQDLILQAIETQVGGTAQATAKASDKMKLAFENVYETVGEALLPVFDDLANEVVALTPEIADALTPVMAELAEVFRKEIIPLIKEFTGWLASPQGTKAVKDLTAAVVDSVKGFFDFTKKLMENWDQIVAVTGVLVSLYGAIKIFTTVTTAARAAMLLFNVALTANPIGALLVVLGLTTAAIIAFSKEVTKESQALKVAANESSALEQKQIQLKEKIKQGGIEVNSYRQQLIKVNDELMQTKTGLSSSAGEANRFKNALANSIPNLKNYRSQLGDTRIDAEKLVNAQRELAYYMAGGKAGTYKPYTAPEETTTTTSGPTPAEQFAEARKKVQKIIQDAQKRVAEAQKSYTKAVTAADKAFLENELKIRQDYGNRLADIIEQSKNRIRDAYKSIAQFNVSTFLANFAEVEQARLDSFNEAKKAAEEVGTAFTEVFTKGDPVKAYLDNLRAKIASNKKVLDTSAKLLEAGFSQTFIEQIISTGETGGIALAEGLLASSPETIREVQALFKEIETVAGSGADALANQLYEKQGLATQELVTLFEDTNQQLLDALEQNYLDYTKSLNDAATALKDSITDITTDFDNAITEMDGKLGGLAATVKSFRNLLRGVADETIAETSPNAKGASGKSFGATGFEFNIDEALGQSQGTYATQFPTIPTNSANTANTTQPATVINVNVKTDQTQSTAQVGAVIANAINKYTANGGRLAVAL
jgi:hypothetical protein